MQEVSRKDLAQIIADKTISMPRAQLAEGIAAYLAETGETTNIDDLLRDVMQCRLEHGIVEAVIVMAHEPNKTVLEDVKIMLKDQFPTAKEILLDVKIDQNVVGGIRVELPRQTLDLTVRGKLNRFKRLIEERN